MVLWTCLSCAATPQSTSAGRFVERVYVDSTDHVHIVYRDKKDVRMPSEDDQVSVDPPMVAPDHRTVGWLVDVPNCCTSYPISLTLVIYRSGKVIQRIGDGMALFDWRFQAGGRQVAVSSGTVHGMNGIHLTLYDSGTGRVIRIWNGGDDDVLPKWGVGLAH